MTRAERFVLIVQTTAIVRDIQTGRTIAGDAVSHAALLAERLFPHVTLTPEGAAAEFLEWLYGHRDLPQWYTQELSDWIRKEPG